VTNIPLQQALARKRELKGSYKAKLSLEKLIVEHEKKKIHIRLLREKYDRIVKDLEEIGSDYCTKYLCGSDSKSNVLPQKEDDKAVSSASRTHLEFLFKEMNWMQNDFDREHKKKQYDAKKSVRICRKELAERRIKKEKALKDQQVELRRKANNMSKMVQVFWKSVEKIVRHNYTV
jgi:hypothetical protein